MRNVQEGSTATAEPELTPNPTQAPEPSPQSTVGGALTVSERESMLQAARAVGMRRAGMVKLHDGAIRMDITIPVEYAESMESQAGGAGENVEEYIQKTVIAALEAYLGQ